MWKSSKTWIKMKLHIHKHLRTQVTYTRGKLSHEPKPRVGTWDDKMFFFIIHMQVKLKNLITK
jgi:hypothetical protein